MSKIKDMIQVFLAPQQDPSTSTIFPSCSNLHPLLCDIMLPGAFAQYLQGLCLNTNELRHNHLCPTCLDLLLSNSTVQKPQSKSHCSTDLFENHEIKNFKIHGDLHLLSEFKALKLTLLALPGNY